MFMNFHIQNDEIFNIMNKLHAIIYIQLHHLGDTEVSITITLILEIIFFSV